jgi:hypothetical protein
MYAKKRIVKIFDFIIVTTAACLLAAAVFSCQEMVKSDITESVQRGYPVKHTVTTGVHRVAFTIGFLFK